MEFFKKLYGYFWTKIVAISRKRFYYNFLYKSFWHGLLVQNRSGSIQCNYFTARPNQGAGIGHQMANWIAGYWFAKQFELSFAHIPFSAASWEHFLGFGENEAHVQNLLKVDKYKKVSLPLFREDVEKDTLMIKKIISSYGDKKVVFVCEQDQFYKDQFGIMDVLKTKFFNAASRKNDVLIYAKEDFNIAIHVRRGDIVVGQKNGNKNLQLRWQDNTYFVTVIKTVLDNISTERPVRIYLFSQGGKEEFGEFEQFPNIHFCLNMSAQDSFLHMVYADLLISSKSSFSYKPALISNGIKVCPANFWHGYPSDESFILVDDNGNFNTINLKGITYD